MLRGARFDSSTVFSLPSLWSAGAAFWQRAFASDFAWKVGETFATRVRSEEHTSELQSPWNPVCRLLLEKKNETVLIAIPRHRPFRPDRSPGVRSGRTAAPCLVARSPPAALASRRVPPLP